MYDLDGWTHYEYQQNLSFDFETAIQKSGTKDYDEFLRGESKSFKIARIYENLGSDTIIDFGKYLGKTLNYIIQNDYSYIEWLIANCTNKQLCTIICNLPIIEEKRKEQEQAVVDFKNTIISIPTFTIDSEIELIITLDRNLSFHSNNATASCRQTIESGLMLELISRNSKEFFYNGHCYWLPILNGKAKRIKGKTLKINGIAKAIDMSDCIKLQNIEVQSFEILKTVPTC